MVPSEECSVGGDAWQDLLSKLLLHKQWMTSLLKHCHVDVPNVWLRTFCNGWGEFCEIWGTHSGEDVILGYEVDTSVPKKHTISIFRWIVWCRQVSEHLSLSLVVDLVPSGINLWCTLPFQLETISVTLFLVHSCCNFVVLGNNGNFTGQIVLFWHHTKNTRYCLLCQSCGKLSFYVLHWFAHHWSLCRQYHVFALLFMVKCIDRIHFQIFSKCGVASTSQNIDFPSSDLSYNRVCDLPHCVLIAAGQILIPRVTV
jgi:hypothetical protein